MRNQSSIGDRVLRASAKEWHRVPNFNERDGLLTTVILPLEFRGVNYLIVRSTVHKTVNLILAVFAGLLSLPALIFGLYLF